MGNLCGPKEPEKKAPEKKAVKTVPPVKPVKPVRPVRTVRARSAAAAAAAEEVFLIEEVKNQDELLDVLRSAEEQTVIVDCYAEWCAPCRLLRPDFERFAKTYDTVIVVKTDVDVAKDIVDKFELQGVPTFLVFQKSKLVETLVGTSVEDLESLFKKYSK